MMQERIVPSPESMPIFLNQRRRHRRIPEPRMLFQARRFSLGYIAPGSFESSAISLSRRIVKCRRGRSVNHGLRMRASSQCHGQQQSSKCDQLLHFISSRLKIPATHHRSMTGASSWLTPVRRNCCPARTIEPRVNSATKCSRTGTITYAWVSNSINRQIFSLASV